MQGRFARWARLSRDSVKVGNGGNRYNRGEERNWLAKLASISIRYGDLFNMRPFYKRPLLVGQLEMAKTCADWLQPLYGVHYIAFPPPSFTTMTMVVRCQYDDSTAAGGQVPPGATRWSGSFRSYQTDT